MRLLLGEQARRAWNYLARMPVGLSIAGVSNVAPVWGTFQPANDTTCTAGTEVTVVTTTSALVAQAGQGYFPVVMGCLTFLMGATASVSLVVAARYNSGSDFTQTQTVDTGLLVNNATISIPIMIVGAAAICNPSGQINSAALEVTALAGTTACTCNKNGSRLAIALVPGGI